MSAARRLARSRGARRRGVARRCAALGALAAGALLLAGCGLGAGKAPSAVHLLVTRDFGASVVRSFSAPHVSGQVTVMSLLMRNAQVSTRYGGGFVQSIDGLAGGQQHGQPVDWFYYVNGIEASKGAASTNVDPGDAIWWDRHDWSQTEDVPAVVGSFPQPFLNGIGGKRLPVRVECSEAEGAACRTVTQRLRAAGVPAAVSALGGAAGAAETLRVAVAPWRAIAGEEGPHELAQGPGTSGVYARFAASGTTLELLNEGGATTQTLRCRRRPDRSDARSRRSSRVGRDGHRRSGRRARRASVRRRDAAMLALPSPSARPGRSRCRGRGAEAMIGSLLFYRRLASPLHATRAAVGALWALSLLAATLILYQPLVLLTLLLAVLAAARGAGVGRELAALAAPGGVRRAADRAGQRARQPRGADRVRAARRPRSVRAG